MQCWGSLRGPEPRAQTLGESKENMATTNSMIRRGRRGGKKPFTNVCAACVCVCARAEQTRYWKKGKAVYTDRQLLSLSDVFVIKFAFWIMSCSTRHLCNTTQNLSFPPRFTYLQKLKRTQDLRRNVDILSLSRLEPQITQRQRHHFLFYWKLIYSDSNENAAFLVSRIFL